MIRSDYVLALEQDRDALEAEVERLGMRLAVLEDFAATVRAACAGKWFGEPVHRMRMVVAALETVR